MSEPRHADRAEAEHWPVSSLRIGELLLRNGAIEQHQLEAALHQQETGSWSPIGRLLIEAGAIDEQTLTATFAQQFGLPVVDPAQMAPDPAAVAALSSEAALQLQALPMRFAGGQVVVAISEPPTPALRPLLERCTGMPVVLALAPADTLADAIEEAYTKTVPLKAPIDPCEGSHELRRWNDENSQAAAGSCSQIVNGRMMEATVGSLDFIPEDIAKAGNGASIPGTDHEAPIHTIPAGASTAALEGRDVPGDDRIVTWLLSKASQLGATAIELQIADNAEDPRIRFRIDGSFQSELRFPLEVGKMVARRVLNAADLDPAITALQKGRLQVHSLEAAIAAEVRAVATASGFTVLVRLEAAREDPPRLAERVAPETLASIRQVLRSIRGLVIVGASAESDRASLLRSLLAEIDVQARSVVAIEDCNDDPCPGVTRLAGDAIDALNASLALDPDVVVVNRPQDTTLIAPSVDLALSDRLVLVAVDGADAASALARARESADAFLVSAAVTLIITADPEPDLSTVQGTRTASDDETRFEAPRSTTVETVIVSDAVRDAMMHDVALGAAM